MSDLPEIHARLTRRPDPAPQVALLDMLTNALKSRLVVHGPHGSGAVPQPVLSLSGVLGDFPVEE
jgi:hypothetical protein